MRCGVAKRAEKFIEKNEGYLPNNLFKMTQYDDGVNLFETERVQGFWLGQIVDYTVRYILDTDKEIFSKIDSFSNIQYLDYIYKILYSKDYRVLHKCKIAFPNNGRRADERAENYHKVDLDGHDTFDLAIMIQRVLKYLKTVEPVRHIDFSVFAPNAKFVNGGHGDFIASDTLIDLKVYYSTEFQQNWALQVIMYYILCTSNNKMYGTINKLGVFNARHNILWECLVSDIPDSLMQDIRLNVIGLK